jgi:cytidylate kinase
MSGRITGPCHIAGAEKKLRVAISGKSGCGNTTVSALLAKALKVKFINFTFRSLSKEIGMPLEEIIKNAKTNDWYDKQVDVRQIELAMQDSCVLGSRLAVWMLKDADLKVYLWASEEVRTSRIQIREGGSLDEVIEFTRLRDAEDTRRYKELYGIDNDNYTFADLIIDTENYDPMAIVRLVLTELLSRRLISEDKVRDFFY